MYSCSCEPALKNCDFKKCFPELSACSVNLEDCVRSPDKTSNIYNLQKLLLEIKAPNCGNTSDQVRSLQWSRILEKFPDQIASLMLRCTRKNNQILDEKKYKGNVLTIKATNITPSKKRKHSLSIEKPPKRIRLDLPTISISNGKTSPSSPVVKLVDVVKHNLLNDENSFSPNKSPVVLKRSPRLKVCRTLQFDGSARCNGINLSPKTSKSFPSKKVFTPKKIEFGSELAQPTQSPEISKDNFLHYFGLLDRVKTPQKQSNTTRLQRFNNQRMLMPFSSELGRLYHVNTVPIRASDRSDRFLRMRSETPSLKDFEVTYNPKHDKDATHYYKFPKRQFSQRGNSGLQDLCKPVSVKVMDIFKCKVNLIRSKVE